MSTILFENGIFHSMAEDAATFSCLLVRNGFIAGTFRSRPGGRFDQVVDLGGKHVYPCLIDGHVHMLYTIAVLGMGFEMCTVNAGGISPDCLAGVEEKIRNYCSRLPADAVVAAHNYIATGIREKRMPTREELDLWGGGRSIVIYSIDGHSTALSSTMLKKIGIRPEGHSGLLTGADNETNQGKLTDIISSALTLPLLAKGIAAFHNICAEYGIGMIGALEGNNDSRADIPTRLILFLARKFDLEVRAYLQYTNWNRVRPFAGRMRHKRLGGCGAWEMDGSVGSHSAAMSVPYKDTGSMGQCYYTQEQVDCFVHTAAAEGYQVASHAIGDRAIDRLSSALNSAPGNLYHRIEHLEFIRRDQLPLLDGKKYAAFMQPGYSWFDKHYLHTYENYLPPEINDRLLLRSIAESGVRICLSSDSPVQSINPYQQMLGMCDFYVPEESLTILDALRAYTVNPATAMNELDFYGTLECGKKADFFTSDIDLLSLRKQEIAAFRPNCTYYGGVPYRRKNGSVAEFFRMLLKKSKKI